MQQYSINVFEVIKRRDVTRIKWKINLVVNGVWRVARNKKLFKQDLESEISSVLLLFFYVTDSRSLVN